MRYESGLENRWGLNREIGIPTCWAQGTARARPGGGKGGMDVVWRPALLVLGEEGEAGAVRREGGHAGSPGAPAEALGLVQAAGHSGPRCLSLRQPPNQARLGSGPSRLAQLQRLEVWRSCFLYGHLPGLKGASAGSGVWMPRVS